MKFLEAKSEDLPEMISLLKLSLGEGLIPKSETYFIWKHFKNPFGVSKILLAKEDGKIIGLRAFMYWSWENSTDKYSAVRAVDTATHPNFQGKGIFKKLTLEAIEQCKKESVSMVFNTPNPISMQGYLKMNWYLAGKMPIYFGFGSMLPQFFKEKNIEKVYNRFDSALAFSQIDEDWSKRSPNDFLHTTLTKKYLNWRYNQCPILKYGAIVSAGKFGMVFRLKKAGGFIELRICELWSEKKEGTVLALEALNQIVKYAKPIIISCGHSPIFDSGNKNPLGLFGPFLKGPKTTIRKLCAEDLHNFENFYKWKPSIGSMELF